MLTKVQEDYLFDIASLTNDKGFARVSDLATLHNVSPASVSIMMKVLKEKELVKCEKHTPITLTDKGKELASKVRTKHALFEQFFLAIGVPSHLAQKDALKIEHNVHPQTIERMQAFIQHCNNKELACGFHCKGCGKE